MPADRPAGRILPVADILALLTYLREERTLMEARTELGLEWADLTATLDAVHGRLVPGGAASVADVEEHAGGVRRVRSDLPAFPDTGSLTEAEGLLLLLALETMAGNPVTYDPEAARSAARRVRALIPGDAVLHVPAPDDPIAPGVRESVREALDRRRALRIRYRDGADRVTEREVEPVLASARDRLAYVHAAEAPGEAGAGAAGGGGEGPVVKSFRLDRILNAEVLERPARRPRGFAFDPADPHGMAEAREWIRVELADGAGWVLNYETVLADDDGGLWLPADNRDRALDVLVALHPHLRAADPGDIRDVARRARRGLAHYAQRSAPDGAVHTRTTSEGD
ncbi:WYL domain-containing protein [Corynebacterium sp. 335C]